MMTPLTQEGSDNSVRNRLKLLLHLTMSTVPKSSQSWSSIDTLHEFGELVGFERVRHRFEREIHAAATARLRNEILRD